MAVGQTIRSAVLATAVCGLLAGCLFDENRAESHAERGSIHLAAGRLDEALIDLHSALKLAPDDARYPEQIARVLIARDDLADARFYLGEAYRLDPTQESAATTLALLLMSSDPDQADALLSEMLERNPESAWAYIGRAEQALVAFDVSTALEAAERAVELDPEMADAHWHLARVQEARIRERSLTGRATDDMLFEEALASLERFAALDETRRWMQQAEIARVLAAWPGHANDAERAIREASDQMAKLELASNEYELLDLAIELARANERVELERWALKRKVEIAPRNYPVWEELASLRTRIGEPPGIVYRRLIAALPQETEPQIRFARHIQRTRTPKAAVRYLYQKFNGDFDDALLLAEIARLYLASNHQKLAFDAVAQLESLYPDARATAIMVAWQLMVSGRPSDAVVVLSELEGAEDDIAALLVLGDAHVRRGDSRAALATLDRAIEMMPHPDGRSLRARAQLLHAVGRYSEARRAFARLSRTKPLQPEDLSLLASCYIETGARAIGVRMLERLVDNPSPPRMAVFELFLREGRSAGQRDRLRAAFRKLIAGGPQDREVLDSYTHFEIHSGAPERAREPLLASLRYAKRRNLPQGRLLLLLARIEAAEGDTRAARDRVLGILDREPGLEGVLEFAVSLYSDKTQALVAIGELTENGKKRDLPASHHALLGRLYYRSDNLVMARWSYEQALSGGLELPILKNDLAFLLARQGRDLSRARLLARQAVQALPHEPGVVDTLGFVLLEMEEYDRAANQFQRALTVARQRDLPQATMQYHLGLALNGLQRGTEAERAFELALALGEKFPDEDEARRELAILRGEI